MNVVLAPGGHCCPMGKTKKALYEQCLSCLGSDFRYSDSKHLVCMEWGGVWWATDQSRRWWVNWVGKVYVYNTFLSIAYVFLSENHTSKTSIIFSSEVLVPYTNQRFAWRDQRTLMWNVFQPSFFVQVRAPHAAYLGNSLPIQPSCWRPETLMTSKTSFSSPSGPQTMGTRNISKIYPWIWKML